MLLAFNGSLLLIWARICSSDMFNTDLGASFLGIITPYFKYIFPVLILVVVIILLISFVPQTVMKKFLSSNSPKDSNLLFYDHLRHLSSDDLINKLKGDDKTVATKLEKDYAFQIITNAGITSTKFEVFKYCGWITISTMLCLIPATIIFIYHKVYLSSKKEVK